MPYKHFFINFILSFMIITFIISLSLLIPMVLLFTAIYIIVSALQAYLFLRKVYPWILR